MEHLDLNVQQVDTLPLVKYYMEQLGIHSLFMNAIPSANQAKTHPAEGLCVLIANIASSSKPLYKIDEWASDYMDGLNVEATKSSRFNDDFLGGCLDKLYNVDRNSLMTNLSAEAIRIHSLETNFFHNDTTSVTVYGKYEDGDPDALQLKHGHNKDGKPECKQLVFGLSVTGDGHVPLHAQTYDGNKSDDKTHIDVWFQLKNMLNKTDFIYTADCKLCTTENMTTIASAGGRFISTMPATRKEVKDFLENLISNEIPWENAYEKENSRKKGKFDIYKTYESSKSTEGYRIIWVHSSAKKEADCSRREHKIKRTEEALVKLQGKLNKYNLKTLEGIQDALTVALKGAEAYFEIEILEEHKILTRKIGRGRPSDDSEFVDEEYVTFKLSWKRNQDEIRKKSARDGVFPLITNTNLESKEVLRTYKNQPYLEKRHSTLKSVLEVAPIYLKKEKRIEAMMFLYFVALMITSLIERNIRLNMKEEDIESLPILAGGKKTKTPTWSSISYLFRNIQIVSAENKGKLIQSTTHGLKEIHKIVLNLLNVPESIYHSKVHDGWLNFVYHYD